jgi:hypothetical protein
MTNESSKVVKNRYIKTNPSILDFPQNEWLKKFAFTYLSVLNIRIKKDNACKMPITVPTTVPGI